MFQKKVPKNFLAKILVVGDNRVIHAIATKYSLHPLRFP